MISQRLKRRIDLVVAVLLGMASLAVYVKTAAPTLLMADPAEFQLASYTLGIAHPTGYPLYLIVGWLWSHLLPLGDPAYRINLLSAGFAACAVGLFYPLALSVQRRALQTPPQTLTRLVAVVAALTLSFSRTFWSQAVRAEVYALNSLFVVAVLLLLLAWSKSDSARALRLAALAYGLSLTHHATMILFLPAILIFVWSTDRSVVRALRSLVTLLILVSAPLLLYLYIPWRAPATPYLYIDLAPGRTLELYDNSLRGFAGFVLGEMFTGELGVQAPLLERLYMALDLLFRQFGVAGAALGALGAVKLGVGGRGSAARRCLILLVLSYVPLVGFTLVYNVGDIHVFYTPSYLIFALWIAVGMAWLVESVRSVRLGAPRIGATAGSYLVLALLAMLPLTSLWSNYQRVDKSADYHAREWAEGVLSQPIPEGTILVSNDRNEITPLLYLQYVEGLRPDLLTIFPLMLPGEEYSNVVRVLDGVIDVGRPIYLVKAMPGLEIKYQVAPSGPLVEVTGPAVIGPPEHVTDLPLGSTLTLVGYDLDLDLPSNGEDLEVKLRWRVEGDLAQDYHTYVHLVDEEGQTIAQSDHRPGQEYYPSSLWQSGEFLSDAHVLPLPTQPGDVTLVAGAYEHPSLTPLGAPLSLGELPPAR